MPLKRLQSALRWSFACLLMALLAACSGGKATPTPDVEATITAVAVSVIASITAQAPTATFEPTDTPTSTPTVKIMAAPTKTPTSTPTQTPTLTSTPRPTPTPLPTATPMPGIGDLVECDDLYAIRVLDPPDFGPFVTSDPPKGAFLKVNFEITNLQSRTASLSLYDDELMLAGHVNGRRLIFEATSYGTSLLEKERGISEWWTDLPPGVPVKVTALFDVNPNASDWVLILEPEEGFKKVCHVEVALRHMTRNISERAPVVIVGKTAVKIRQGPGTNYAVVAEAGAGEVFELIGRNATSDWWQICCVGKDKGWVAASLVSTRGDLSTVPVTKDIPPPPPTPTPFPKTVPMGQDFKIGQWDLKLYAVKKAKTIYYFGKPETAQGHFLMAFIEFRNNGSGTRSPNDDLDFYLVDERGRRWNFDEFGKAVLPAAWQFTAGHLYDDIQPGSMLGIVLPFDVPSDTTHVFLRVRQNTNFVMYLGDVSTLPISEK